MPLAPPPPPPPAWLTSGGKQAGEEGSSPAGASRATTWAKQVRPYAYETADPASDGSVPIVLSGDAGDGWSWCDRRLLRRSAARHGDEDSWRVVPAAALPGAGGDGPKAAGDELWSELVDEPLA